MSAPIEIDLWSDVVCPWCFIGRRRLQKAIANHANGREVIVRHRAFQLQPDATQVMRTDEMLASKYKVDKAQVAAMQANVCSIADGEGLCYDLTDTLSGNTADAHRLILWAEEFGKGDDLLEAIYSAYFEKKQPIFSHEELVAIASSVAISAEDALNFLKSDEQFERVAHDQELARALGANGVPFFLIDGQYAISGAQPQEEFDSIFTAVQP